MQAEALSAFLRQVHDPASPADRKHHAEQQLNAFSNTIDGLEWALTCVQSPNVDPQHQFFAASVLEGAVARRWAELPPTHQATLQNCLWMHVIQTSTYSLPHFVTSKLRAALAHLACINWQLQFWVDLRASLTNPATAEAGVRLLGATLEQLHSMAQGTTSVLSGKVLSSDLPTMQSHRQEAQIMAFQMLCPLLEHLITTTTTSTNGINNITITMLAANAPPGLATATLDALRVAISTSNVDVFSTHSSQTPGTELASQLVSHLLPFLSLAAAAVEVVNKNMSTDSNNQLVILAMSCLEDLINRPHQPLLKQKIVAHVLPALSALCRSWSNTATTTATTTVTVGAASLDIDLLGVFTRLLTQTLQHSFPFAASNSEVAAGLQEILREITNFAAAAVVVPNGNPSGTISLLLPVPRVLAASEAWHAVLSYMEDLEALSWNEEGYDNTTNTNTTNAMIKNDDGNKNDDADPSNSIEKYLLSFYKQGILHFSRLLLSIFFTENTHQDQKHPSPPFLLQNLDSTPGSGAMLEDWVAAVGENNEDFQIDSPTNKESFSDFDNKEDIGTEEEEGKKENGHDLSSSEAHVFAQQVEFFIAHATSSYNKELVPVLFKQLGPAMTASAAAQARQQQHPDDQTAFYLCNFKAELALKLVARCAPHLPTNTLLSVPSGGGDVAGEEQLENTLTGGHVLQLIQALLHFGSEQLKIVNSQAQQAQQQEQQKILMASVVDTLVTIYRTLSPLMTTWLPQIMLTRATMDSDVEVLVSQLLQAVVEFVAAGIESGSSLNKINNLQHTGSGAAGKRLSIAASQTFLSVTSIALSSGMKPPVNLVQTMTNMPAFGILSMTVASALHTGGQNSGMPRGALRSLIVSLSDLTLRSWGSALQANTLDINARKMALASVTAPLLHILEFTAAQAQLPASAAQPQVCLAASLATDVVESYVGSSKIVRGAVFEVFAQPMLVAVMTILKFWNITTTNTNNNFQVNSSSGKMKSKLGTTLLTFISSCLRAFPAELGTSSIGELLSGLVAAFSSNYNNRNYNVQSTMPGVEASLDSDIVLLSIITSALSQGGSKHASLVTPAMHFGLQIWDKAALCGGATHIKAQVLTSLLSIMAQHWRTLGGGGGGGGDRNAADEGQEQPPAEVVTATLTHVSSFLDDAASTRVIPSARDVKLVLETLIDIQSRSKLFWKPFFSGWKDKTMESILLMLLTRMYTGAQESLIDTLYQLAAANWSHFLLGFLPAFAEKGLSGLGARGAELAAGLGTGDMEAWAFEKGVLAFVNDAIYWEKRM